MVQESHLSLGIEIFGLMPIDKFPLAQAHRAENLLRVAFAPGRDSRLAMPKRTSLMQRWTLPKGRFVLVNDYRAFGLGFFSRFG